MNYQDTSRASASRLQSTPYWLYAGSVLLMAAVLWGVAQVKDYGSLNLFLPSPALNTWITGVLIAPIAEELFFRTVVQESLLRRGMSATSAIVLTALAFALAHLLTSSLGHAVATALPALFIGFVFHKARSYGLFAALVLAVVLHSLFNAVWLAGLDKYIATYVPWLI